MEDQKGTGSIIVAYPALLALNYLNSNLAQRPATRTMNAPRVVRNHPVFQRLVDSILDEPRATHTWLYERATACLQVFDEPACRRFNMPHWVHPSCILEGKFSVKALIEAFYHTAQDLHLANGSRFILANVFACGLVADAMVVNPRTADGLSRSEALARELEALVREIWWQHLSKLRKCEVLCV